MKYSLAGGKLIQEKNQKQKISWHCSFKKAKQKRGFVGTGNIDDSGNQFNASAIDTSEKMYPRCLWCLSERIEY
jgi:hypothetical protein